MFDILFMRQKRNETARLIWIAPHGPFIRSDQSSKCRAWREFTRADALGHASIKQHCEIQCEALEFSDEHKWLGDLN